MERTDLKGQLEEVASRIRTMREITGLSEEEMARHTGVSPEEYRACERGERDFSFTFIYKCAQRFAIDHPDRVDRLVLFNTTPRTGPWLGDIGEGWNLAARDPESYYYATIPVIYSPQFYLSKNDWMTRRHEALHAVFSNQDFIRAMIRLTDSARNYDVTEDLHKIAAPTLVVSCREDYLTPMAEQELICSKIPNSKHVILPGSGHASMYEQPLLFTALTLGFCNTSKTEYQIT